MMEMTMHNRSILIVEDDPDIRGALAAFLESYGYPVVEAEHGQEALRCLQGETGFCLIVLDLFMPKMNGWAFRTEQVKEPRWASIPVLVISADSVAARRAVTPGVVAAMTKPVELERLLEVVSQHC
jgi:CheY-like chemotaxis protein